MMELHSLCGNCAVITNRLAVQTASKDLGGVTLDKELFRASEPLKAVKRCNLSALAQDFSGVRPGGSPRRDVAADRGGEHEQRDGCADWLRQPNGDWAEPMRQERAKAQRGPDA